MRIVQLANFFGATSGGLRTSMRALAQHYTNEGHDVVRIVPGERDDVTSDGDTQVMVLKGMRLGDTGYRVIRPGREVHRLLRSLRPDSIELSDKSTLVAPAATARSRGARVVLMSHERLDAILQPRVPRWFPLSPAVDLWNRRLARAADTVVCASRFAAHEWSRIGVEHVQRVPLGVDLDTFRPAHVDQRSDAATLRMVLVGRLSAEKVPMVAIDAVRHLVADGVACHLDVAGDGPMFEQVAAAARELPVTMHGHVGDRRALAELLGQAHVALAPCGYETFGLAALEALACGTPVVVAHTGALAELIAPGIGVTAAPTGHSFAHAALEITRHRAGGTRTDSTARIARAHAERFSWSTTGDAMLAVHHGISIGSLHHASSAH